jgi:hypothetical protein
MDQSQKKETPLKMHMQAYEMKGKRHWWSIISKTGSCYISGLFSAEGQGTDVTTKLLGVYDLQNVRNLTL